MDLTLGTNHFLSKVNPAATVDQRDAEALALKITKEPRVEAAKKEAARRFKIMLGDTVPEEAWDGFDERLEEWALNYLLLAVNRDSNYPKFVGYKHTGPHEWFGMKMLGSRGPTAGECIENYYTLVPLDHQSRFEVHGKVYDPGVGDAVFAISASLSHGTLVNVLDGRSLKIDSDGSYVITIGPEPANGRPNYLQTTRDAQYLFVRNSHVVWQQKVHAYRVRRLDPPTADPLSYSDITGLAARFIVDDVPASCLYQRMLQVHPANVTTPVVGSAHLGGTSVQKATSGRLDLQDDEAFILKINPGGSRYWNVISYNWWFTTSDFWNHQVSLNTNQSAADEDGNYTYVFAKHDPGVHNWIDTVNLQHTKYVIRLRQLPEERDQFWTPTGGDTKHRPGGNPEVNGQLVKLSQLNKVLSGGVKRVSSAERSQQIRQRVDDFNSWWVV